MRAEWIWSMSSTPKLPPHLMMSGTTAKPSGRTTPGEWHSARSMLTCWLRRNPRRSERQRKHQR